MDEHKLKLKRKLSQLPTGPGVYIHRDNREKIIYVGKAANLRSRVRQYFQESTIKNTKISNPKTWQHIQNISDVEWIETQSEIDALFLEAELIKRYKPKYNIELRDDKSSLYVKINFSGNNPNVTFTRIPMDDGAKYFGPYENGAQIKKAMRVLRKIFPYSTHNRLPNKLCLHYHLGLCPGLEEGKISLEEYKANLKKLATFIEGKSSRLIKQLEKEMTQLAKEHKFEQAANVRNQLTSIKALRKQMILSQQEFMDVSKDQALSGLAKLAKLPAPPRRIEGYDISHMQGSDNTASMVVFTHGMPNRAEYRKFKLRVPGNNDFAHMQEVISRRFSKSNLKWPVPDLILIDGGKGQLSSVLRVLNEKKINVPAIAISKRNETIITKDKSGFKEINLDKNSHTLKLLQRIRDESHRFAVSYHSVLKTKRQRQSLLEEAPGIGPKLRGRLMRRFGSIKAIKEAETTAIADVVGPKRAQQLKRWLDASSYQNKN